MEDINNLDELFRESDAAAIKAKIAAKAAQTIYNRGPRGQRTDEEDEIAKALVGLKVEEQRTVTEAEERERIGTSRIVKDKI